MSLASACTRHMHLHLGTWSALIQLADCLSFVNTTWQLEGSLLHRQVLVLGNMTCAASLSCFSAGGLVTPRVPRGRGIQAAQ